LKSEGR
jgi:hypothetical protein